MRDENPLGELLITCREQVNYNRSAWAYVLVIYVYETGTALAAGCIDDDGFRVILRGWSWLLNCF